MVDINDVEFICEVFDFCVNQWSLVVSFVVLRVVCVIASVDEIVYVFGGDNQETYLDGIEMFDVKFNEWYEVFCILLGFLLYV